MTYSEKEGQEFLSTKNDWYEIFTALDIPCTVDYLYNKTDAERWLCICRGGNTRSAALAFLLKYKYMKDALTMSLEKNTCKGTQAMLFAWAQRIVVTEAYHLQLLPPRIRNKTSLIDLTATERLRAQPYEIEFLKKVDAKLKEIL